MEDAPTLMFWQFTAPFVEDENLTVPAPDVERSAMVIGEAKLNLKTALIATLVVKDGTWEEIGLKRESEVGIVNVERAPVTVNENVVPLVTYNWTLVWNWKLVEVVREFVIAIR